MAREPVFTRPTRLWSRAEGWREWPVGEYDPGGAWYEEENGDEKAPEPDADVVKALAEARKQAEVVQAQLETCQASLAVAGGRADKAEAQIAALTQRAADAERAQRAAEEQAAELTRERDQARAALADVQRRFAAFDGDGDGKPGGRKKAQKAAQEPAETSPATNAAEEASEAADAPPEAQGEAVEDEQVAIPDDYATIPWFGLKKLASSFTEQPVENKADALAAIEAELTRRAG